MFHLQVLTPEEIFYDETILSLIAPGVMGYFGVLANHAPMISLLKQGKFTITDKNQQKLYYVITGGVLEVSHNQAYLLTDSILPTESFEIDSGI